ncbi:MULTISPECIES: LysR family transcriptional regulator [unclassified Rhizobium]|uniref:LysR family transcriptional regulator n=1 Tax=unclassified Rhizobium TaxID=2613769 RepID=UPI001ADC5C12|nr:MULTISPECIES: LysR family transcriptional regulator [unclassified Rhizobium]MBO9123735.1 LysR family transcriptional regulator [Rhizobium sp. 16-488-2b]MBO9174267.1 LysR family transcriptional regulator [Rhizobium sp. 16-488-2a]
MQFTLRQLEVLVAIIDHRGFSAAAEALGMGQSSVSHSLASLEKLSGGELVRRSSPATMTALGHELVSHARAVIAAARTLEAAMAIDRDTDTPPPVRLAIPPTAARSILPKMMLTWREHAPKIRVELFEGFDDEIRDWLDTGSVDAAILIDPDRPSPGAITIATDGFQAVLRADHPLAGEQEITLDDLLDDPILASAGGCEVHIEQMHRLAGLEFKPAQRIRDLSTLLSMVAAGLGVAIVPSLTASMLPDGLVLVPVFPRVVRALVFTGPDRRPWHPYVGLMRDILKEDRQAA